MTPNPSSVLSYFAHPVPNHPHLFKPVASSVRQPDDGVARGVVGQDGPAPSAAAQSWPGSPHGAPRTLQRHIQHDIAVMDARGELPPGALHETNQAIALHRAQRPGEIGARPAGLLGKLVHRTRFDLGDHRKQLPVLVRQNAREALDRREPDLRLAGAGLELPARDGHRPVLVLLLTGNPDLQFLHPQLLSFGLRRPLPLLRLKHLIPNVLHRLEPQRGDTGERGYRVAADLIVQNQAVADQA